MYFIDRLDIYQDHTIGGLPVVGKELIARYDLTSTDTNPTRVTNNPMPLDGSYSTSLRVRCDGRRVSIEGNPSRWQRIDNLFGFSSIDECIQVYNIELQKLGLPPFTKATDTFYSYAKKEKENKLITNGAKFRRIDITRNLSVGKDNERHFLRGLSSQRIGKGIMPHLFPNGNTLSWKTCSWINELYIKAEEMRLSRNNKLIKKLNIKEVEYRNKIITYCDDIGLVRDEKQFKQPFLNRNNLCFYGLVDENDYLKYLTDIDDMLNKIEISTMDYENISDILISKKICKTTQSANSTQSILFSWLYNKPIKKTSMYYVHKARLLKLGIDISVPHDVTKLMPQLRSQKEITVNIAQPPDWYQMPSINNLKVVP